ncbi:hypothetical protein ACKI2C_02175 [Streptomyces brasiliscabiei]
MSTSVYDEVGRSAAGGSGDLWTTAAPIRLFPAAPHPSGAAR